MLKNTLLSIKPNFSVNNQNMNGRVFGIKKSLILRSSALLFSWAFFAFIFVCIFVLKNPPLWFFGFCLFLGVFELIKGFLFGLDSSLYFGSLLTGIGTVGFIFIYTNTSSYAAFFICLAFILASVVTYIFCKQSLHLILAFSIFFVSLYSLLLAKNFISTSIFIAFVVPFLVLLVLEMFLHFKRR